MKKFLLFLSVYFCFSAGFALEAYKNDVIASFYGADFHGKKTSSGELFNMYDYTCANKELPFNTVLKVTNLENNKSVQVRVNDRGPFVVGREIDLSTAAARTLGMTKSGTTKVNLEIVKMGENTKQSLATAESAKRIMEKKSPSTAKTPVVEKTSTSKSTVAAKETPKPKPIEPATVKESSKNVSVEEGKIWDIQVASFSSRENAEIFARELHKKGFEKLVYQSTKDVTRVVVSKVPSADVENIKNKLLKAGYSNFVIRERKNS